MAVTPSTTPSTPASPVGPSTSSRPAIRSTETIPAIPAIQATRLGCGRDVDDLWDTIAEPPNAHEQNCPYCTQARAELAALSEATRDLTAADQQDENLRDPDQMLANVLAIVRTEVRRGKTIPLQHRTPGPRVSPVRAVPTESDRAVVTPDVVENASTDAGLESDRDATVDVPDLTVSELVIATVVRETCDRNPDVEIRRVSINTTAETTSPARKLGDGPGQTTRGRPGDVTPTDVSMDLQAAVSPNAAIPALTTGLRTAIQAAVTAQIGVTVSRINIDVQDLLDA